jgi:hypothetical protein
MPVRGARRNGTHGHHEPIVTDAELALRRGAAETAADPARTMLFRAGECRLAIQYGQLKAMAGGPDRHPAASALGRIASGPPSAV